MTNQLELLANKYLDILCYKIEDRSVGSEGNRQATDFFVQELSENGWDIIKQEFDCIDWVENGAKLTTEDTKFEVFASPYSLGIETTAKLIAVSTIQELSTSDAKNKILLMHGEIAKEQLMPKNFVFYNPESHKKIISLLESSKAVAIVCATGRNPELAGGVYPFPLIEDGDFNIPSVFTTEEIGEALLSFEGKTFTLVSRSKRIPAQGFNISGIKGNNKKRIVVTAHIDAKKGTPGAIDNATGVIVLLLIAKLLKNYDGKINIELVALNGEDYYAVPGQMEYIKLNANQFDSVILNINIDGAGYFEDGTVFSFFNIPLEVQKFAMEVMAEYNEMIEGPLWPQGDHSIFVQQGCPAIAVSSEWFLNNMQTQEITHTPNDNPSIVNIQNVVRIAEALKEFLKKMI